MNDVQRIARADGDALVASGDPMMEMVSRFIGDPDVSVDKLERMLAMKERIDAQNAKIAFADALSLARADIPPIVKDATVDFTSQKGRTHYKHETLAGIAKTIDPILSQNGLSYRFRTNQDGGRVTVTCIIAHRGGHSEETTLAGAPDQSGNKNNFQAVGSAVTYLQRYTLKAALGLSAEVDDDGRAAGPAVSGERDQERAKPASSALISEEEYRALKAKAEEAGVSVERLCEATKIEHLHEMPESLLRPVNNKLDATIKARKAPRPDADSYAEAIDHYGADNE